MKNGWPGLRLAQSVLSNIDLVRRIWDPTLPIRPTWQRLDIKVTSSLAKMLYANSITLTPGTLTTDVRKDHFMVHSLTSDGIEELSRYVRDHQPAYEMLSILAAEERQEIEAHLAVELGMQVLPASIVTDGKGTIVGTFAGTPTVSQLRALLPDRPR